MEPNRARIRNVACCDFEPVPLRTFRSTLPTTRMAGMPHAMSTDARRLQGRCHRTHWMLKR
eukprot:5254227-Alexandrium_andersonii.AAC.1